MMHTIKLHSSASAGEKCYSSVRTGSYESRKKKGLPLDGICQSLIIPEWRLQMMANLIFRDYLAEKDKVLALANSMVREQDRYFANRKQRAGRFGPQWEYFSKDY